MAKLDRVTAKVFADSAAATEIGQFGSAVAGSKLETADVAAIQGLSAWLNGWSEALVPGNRYPALQEMNGLLKVLSYQGAYALQEGIAEYDSATTYYIGSIVKKTGTFELYGSLTDNNVGNALSNGTNWKFLIDLAKTNNDAIELRNIIKSCKLDSNGECELLSYSGSDVTVQSTSTNPLIYVNPNSTTSTITSQNSLDFASGYADGKYPLIQLSDGTVDVLKHYETESWQSWIQPVFSGSNTASDGSVITFSAEIAYGPGYGAMDGVVQTSNSSSFNGKFWFPNTATGFWQVKFPYPIKITALTHYCGGFNAYAIDGRYYTSSSKTTPIGNAITQAQCTNYGTGVQIQGIPAEGIITDTIYFEKTGGGVNVGIGELGITATKLVGSGLNNASSYTESKTEPTNPTNNDYWLNTSVIPNTLQKYVVSEWVEKQGVFIGSVNVASNLVASVEQPVIPNKDVGHTVIETYKNGNSWYRIYSDGWIEQGGYIAIALSGAAETFSLLTAFSNTDYSILLTGNSLSYSQNWQAIALTATTFSAQHGISAASRSAYWYACGY